MDKIAAFTEILAQDPANAFARYGLAMEYGQTGQTSQALAEFAKLNAEHPDYVPGYQMAGQLLLKHGDTGAAKDVLTRGLAAAQRTGNGHAASEIAGMLDEIA
jgi:cytochrome c-type biogenesis protein CcmH/NrfG